MTSHKIAFLILGLMVAGCAYPTSTAIQGQDKGGIFVADAPADARLVIDGADMGSAAQYDGKKQIVELPPGMHSVEFVTAAGTVKKNVYVGAGAKVGVDAR